MARLEEIKKGAHLKGIFPDGSVEIIDVKWHGLQVIEITYKDDKGNVGNELVFRDKESGLEIVSPGKSWSLEADGRLLRLVSEANRIRLAHLFDPLLAVHTSIIEPLPHQITAVYEAMLPRQPLRFLLADDPGAGKTIMAGLLIRELIIRGDVTKCLICCPGHLVDQWQDELWGKFHLDFKIISNQSFEDSKTGNPFLEYPFVIARMDHISRNEEILAKIESSEWDMVVVDEAHKMSAHFYGNDIKETLRYKLGKILGAPERTRHFLLMTATPHNGKEEDFQLFMGLIDKDRFEGKFKDGVHAADASDLMRRMVKENMIKFDGKRLFPERIAYTASYSLSKDEAILYSQVTEYVREEMNRADKLTEAGEGRRGNRIGFALTILQRRLASSPEAIYQSLKRRREKLEKRLREEKLLKKGKDALIEEEKDLPEINDIIIDDINDCPDSEVQQVHDLLSENASAAKTIGELQIEIEHLNTLEALAKKVRLSGTDKKWEQLSELLQNNENMFDAGGHRRKLIIFTEHKDTLNYLVERITTLIGKEEALVTIHGGMTRDERRKNQESFIQYKEVEILVATDAAGEGINLQRANLLVNYDLPWNPNRLEQRFGRIHRIGQEEVCHMWNLVAKETREGDVFITLLKKLENARKALGGGVFDVLGTVFQDVNLRKLLIEAIRYGENPEVKAKLTKILNEVLDQEHIKKMLHENALSEETFNSARLNDLRSDMERAEARRLQPHFIRSFFLEAFRHLGGKISEREQKRFEITYVPIKIRNHDLQIRTSGPIIKRYERVCFDKELISVQGKPYASFICPGHPLLDLTIDIILEEYRSLLKIGAVLVDPADFSEDARALLYLEHSLRDERKLKEGGKRVISKRMQFVEIDKNGNIKEAGYAPYLDYRPLKEEEKAALEGAVKQDWNLESLESQVISYAIETLVPEHLMEVKNRKEELISKTEAAVRDRLTKEINYWDHKANSLKDQELAGKPNAKLNSAKARQRADELQARLEKRLKELDQERRISAMPPVVIGGALVVPIGLLIKMGIKCEVDSDISSKETAAIERLAMEKVMQTEKSIGRIPEDISSHKCGYDIESADPLSGRMLFIEVKGRIKDAQTVTVTKNEILTGLNKPDNYILTIVFVEDGKAAEPVYIRGLFSKELDFGVESVNYKMAEILTKAVNPNTFSY